MKITKELIYGFCGLGFVGGNLANNFEERGYKVLRYSLDEPYIKNKEKIKECPVVFIAVPSPTILGEFDNRALHDAMSVTSEDAIIIVKSTVPIKEIEKLHDSFPTRKLFYSPEFLTEIEAKKNTDFPDRNIVGIMKGTKEIRELAEEILKILPEAPYNLVTTYKEASLIKYGHNCYLYQKNVFFNMLYDMAQKFGADYESIRVGITRDTRINPSHTQIFHQGGRGAGGKCLIKDFVIFQDMYRDTAFKDRTVVKDEIGEILLKSIEIKNKHYLKGSEKDKDIFEEVYGKEDLV